MHRKCMTIMFAGDRGPSDPVRVSKTSEIDGGISDPEDHRVVEVTNEAGNQVGTLVRWDSGCWIWAETDSIVDL